MRHCLLALLVMPEGLWLLLIFIALVIIYTIAKVFEYIKKSEQQWREAMAASGSMKSAWISAILSRLANVAEVGEQRQHRDRPINQWVSDH